jgi:hypothetical protein
MKTIRRKYQLRYQKRSNKDIAGVDTYRYMEMEYLTPYRPDSDIDTLRNTSIKI